MRRRKSQFLISHLVDSESPPGDEIFSLLSFIEEQHFLILQEPSQLSSAKEGHTNTRTIQKRQVSPVLRSKNGSEGWKHFLH